MGQKRKKRYQRKEYKGIELVLTGHSFLKYDPVPEIVNDDGEEDGSGEVQTEIIRSPEAGDLQFFLFKDTLGRNEEEPAYDFLGGTGYLKARVFDGKGWQVVVMDDLFPNRIHHFHKKEMPYDTYLRCKESVERELKGTILHRGYRSHYEPVGMVGEEE